MIASNILGRGIGEKKLELIFKEYPFICIDKNKALELKIDDIKKINGMGDITSKQFIDNLNKFFEFYQELEFKEIEKSKSKSKSPPKIINKKIENKHFVFSGFRNKEFEDYIKENNGIIDNNIIKNTNYLIIKDNTKITTKIKIAEEKGLIIILSKDFLNFIKNDL
jgi:NAD-dependent DNA ligase